MIDQPDFVPAMPPVSLVRPLAWIILGLALGLGLFGSLLLEVKWGLNIALWTSLLVLIVWWFSRQYKQPNQVWWFWFFALVLAWCFVLRDSSLLRFWNGIALLLSLGLAAGFARFGMGSLGFISLLWVWLEALVYGFFGWLGFMINDLPWFQVTNQANPKRFMPFVRGLLLLLPLLLVFAALLGSADAVFATLLTRVFSWNIDSSFWWWLLRFIFMTILVLGLLRFMVLGQMALPTAQPIQLGRTELMIVLGGLNALFAAFIIIQFGYFFGGQAQITQLTGLTYAEYARRGFNELVQVVVLAFPVLIVSLHLAQTDQKTTRAVRYLSGITLVLLLVMLYSAWQRLGLYREAYGLTEIRFYTTVGLIWLAAMLIFYAITALQAHYSRFVQGVVLSAFLTLVVLNIINPSAIIVQSNLARENMVFDIEYALKLGADAVPSLKDAKSGFSVAEQQRLELLLKERWGSWNSDWRSWNLAVIQAHKSSR
jgi:hypothetical protein